jgi:dolichyl-phosphate-mannose--protein O-mannosyl transferase
VRNFTRVNYFSGIGDLTISLESSEDGQTWDRITETFREDGSQAHEGITRANYASYFSWHVTRVNASGRYLRITTWNDNTELFEIAVYNGDELLPIVHSSAPQITDEQMYAQRSKTHLNSTYFDEIYHARTAYEIVHKLPIYETTHPPLGKALKAASISIFGMTPFAWRLSGTIAGILMIPALYLLANKLFGKKTIALAAAALFALDFMHFSLTRIATIDSYPVLFLIFAFYFLADYINKTQSAEFNSSARYFLPLFWAGIFFGLACAAKWSGLYAAPGILILLLITWYQKCKIVHNRKKNRRIVFKHFLICIIAFIAIPVIIYCLSYVPQMRYDLGSQTPLQYIISYQYNMYDYHSKLTATHAFSSPAISWPIVLRPLWAFINSESYAYGLVNSINFLGNPAIWWTGLIAMIALLVWSIYSFKTVPMFITVGFLTNYMVWVLVPRIAFIYHYFASVPFIILAICYWASFSWEVKKAGKKNILQKKSMPSWSWIPIVIIALILFIWFYPVLSGETMTQSYAKTLRWFGSWQIF